jgi:hypothetical protein
MVEFAMAKLVILLLPGPTVRGIDVRAKGDEAFKAVRAIHSVRPI